MKKGAASKDIEMDYVDEGQDAAAKMVQDEEGLVEKSTASKKGIESTSGVCKEESVVKGTAKCTESLALPEWLPTTTQGNACKKCSWEFVDGKNMFFGCCSAHEEQWANTGFGNE